MSNSYTRVTIVPAGTDMNIDGRALSVSEIGGISGTVAVNVIPMNAPDGASSVSIIIEAGIVVPLAVRYVDNTSAYDIGVLS